VTLATTLLEEFPSTTARGGTVLPELPKVRMYMSRAWNRFAGILIVLSLGFVACSDENSSKNNAQAAEEAQVGDTDEALAAAAEVDEGTPQVATAAAVGSVPHEAWENLDDVPQVPAGKVASDEDAPDDALQSPEEPALEGDLVAEGEELPLVDPSNHVVDDLHNNLPEAP
jgi:hypothetical protein